MTDNKKNPFVRLTLVLALLIFQSGLFAQNAKSIKFEHGSWSQIVEKAKEENKLIFIDFYTQWCGPCLNMAEEVFILPTVYTFYNNNFINAKIDAEAGEGIKLAKKYQINSYPTYLFIDPNSQEAVHKSGSRQDPEVFIFTGESALNPQMRSFYLESEYDKQKGDLTFLKKYAAYKISVYDRKALEKVLDQMSAMNIELNNKDAWELFVNNITGYDNAFIKELFANYSKYVNLYGKEVVDAKLAKETSYAPLELLSKLPDFEGRYTNMLLNEINTAIRAKNYEKCATLIDSALGQLESPNSKIDREKFLHALKFTARMRESENFHKFWLMKCAQYIQYIAYNLTDRRDPYIHFEYAQLLEKIIKTMPNASEYFPSSISNQPTIGKTEYTMRPDILKAKPKK